MTPYAMGRRWLRLRRQRHLGYLRVEIEGNDFITHMEALGMRLYPYQIKAMRAIMAMEKPVTILMGNGAARRPLTYRKICPI